MSTVADPKTTMRSQWGAVAGGWDAWFDWYARTFEPVFTRCCDAADLAPGMRLLDVASGSGQPAFTAARRVDPGRVTAIDMAPEMLAVARRRAAERGVQNVEFLEMDGDSLRFPDASFDAVTCAYALMFCPDPVQAVLEARRVLKPGGRYVAVVWDQPANSPMLTIAGRAVGQFFPPQPATADAPGVFRFADARHLETTLRAGGLHDIHIDTCRFTAALASPAEYWRMFTEMAAGIEAKIATMSPADLEQLTTLVDTNAAAYVEGGVLRLPASSYCVVGRA